MTTTYTRSIESTQCASVKPNSYIESSGPLGWTSLHLDHHEGVGESDVFDTYATRDLTLVVATKGEHDLHSFTMGRWRSARYQPGTIGMTPPGESARLRWRTPSIREPFRTLHIYLPGLLLADVAEEYRRAGQATRLDNLSSLAFRDPIIAGQVHALLVACRAGEPDLYAAGASRWLVTHLLSRQTAWRHVADESRVAPSITDRRLARVIEYMSAHLDQPLTLHALAREAGISVHHFGRRFRESTGMGPAAFAATLRIDQARSLLRTTDLSISEVGVRCGYSSATAFATAFQRQVGVPPRDYRASKDLRDPAKVLRDRGKGSSGQRL